LMAKSNRRTAQSALTQESFQTSYKVGPADGNQMRGFRPLVMRFGRLNFGSWNNPTGPASNPLNRESRAFITASVITIYVPIQVKSPRISEPGFQYITSGWVLFVEGELLHSGQSPDPSSQVPRKPA